MAGEKFQKPSRKIPAEYKEASLKLCTGIFLLSWFLFVGFWNFSAGEEKHKMLYSPVRIPTPVRQISDGTSVSTILLPFKPSSMADMSSGSKTVLAVIIGGIFYVVATLGNTLLNQNPPVDQPATISVSADAKVSAAPDVAILNFGITTGRQATAKDAINVVRTKMDSILAAVKKAGIDEKDISTASFSLNPIYDYTQNGQIPRGFEASQSLTVKVRDLDKAGDILTVATEAGANQSGGVSFTIDNPDDLKAKARKMAVDKARAKAQVIADDLGVKLGRVTGFSDDSGSYYPPTPMMARDVYSKEQSAGMADIQLPAGEQDVHSAVSITYEIR